MNKLVVNSGLILAIENPWKATRKRFAAGSQGIISKNLSELPMSSSAVAVDGPRYMTNMRSEKSDQ